MTDNRFDEKAATWDADPSKVERAAKVARAIEGAVPLTGSTRLFEYGAGTGLVSQALRESVGPLTLVDTSAGMREVMLAKVEAGTLRDARVWGIDLESEPAPDEQFDVVVTVMTLHHIRNLARVLAAFADLLAPGGRLCIADLEQEDGSFHDADFDGHRGFERGALAHALASAGFGEITFSDCAELVRDGTTYPIFLATCTRYRR